VLLIGLAIAVLAHAGEPGWRTGRITTVRVLERSEVQGSVTPPVQEDGRGQPQGGRSYGASAYLVVQSGKDTYQAQYAGPQIGALEQLRSRKVQFRIAGSKLYLKPATGRPIELQLLPAKRPPAETKNPRK
jgi:hypothetical protein